jgi:hypothetical protein
VPISPRSTSAIRGSHPWGAPLTIAHAALPTPHLTALRKPAYSAIASRRITSPQTQAVLPVSFGRFLLAGAPSSTGFSLYSLKSTASYTALSATAFPLPAEPVKG